MLTNCLILSIIKGIVAVINIPKWQTASFLTGEPTHNQLILDGIADPGNLGNILRYSFLVWIVRGLFV